MRDLLGRHPALFLTVAATILLGGCSAASTPDGHDVGDHPVGPSSSPVAGATELAVTAEGLAFAPDRLEVRTGEAVNVALTSTDVLHDLTIDEVGFHLVADGGETAVGGAVFEESGTYVAYCTVPGHREAGMELPITVGS
jgi:uncharacterized cupredoxin-like copper-binding protein